MSLVQATAKTDRKRKSLLMHSKTNSSLKIKTNITTNCKTNSLKTNDNDKNETPFYGL